MNIKLIYAFLFCTLPTLVVFVVVLVLMKWYIPTRVKVNLTVDRAVFSAGGTDRKKGTKILDPTKFKSITIEKFANIEFSPKKLEVADPNQYILIEDWYPESAWTTIKVTSPEKGVVIRGVKETLQTGVTIENVNPELNTSGILDRISVLPGSEVTLEVIGTQIQHLIIKVNRQKSFARLSINEPFQLITTYGRVSGISELPYRADSLTYKAQLPNRNRIVRIIGQPSFLVLILTILPEKDTKIFSIGGIPVTSLDFTRQDETGERLTSLVKNKDGEITYPDYPKIDRISFKAPDFIGLDQLEKFRIEEIVMDPEHNGIKFLLNGIARHVKTGSPEFQKDHHLTLFDTLWQNPRLLFLLSIIVWVFPTTVGAYRLYKEVKG